MDTELLEAEELDVDQTRSARHERPVSPRSSLPPPASGQPTISGSPSARDHQLAARHERYGHAGDPWKNGP
jgi:hypothetical protein